MNEQLIVAGIVGVVFSVSSQVVSDIIKKGLLGNQEKQNQSLQIAPQEHLLCAKHEHMQQSITETGTNVGHILKSIDRIETKVDTLFDEAFTRIRETENKISNLEGQKNRWQFTQK
jgi:CRISPR/Cas system CSM-associated protein Csm2 small subunit